MDKTPDESSDPIDRLRGGDRQALASLFDQPAPADWWNCGSTLVSGGRLDASDVLQEAFLDVSKDLDAYLADPKLPPAALAPAARRPTLDDVASPAHGHEVVGAGLEISLYQGALPGANSAALASMLLGRIDLADPGGGQRAELVAASGPGGVEQPSGPSDREVLAYVALSRASSRLETAQVLGITQEAGAKRYFRALKRLKDVLATLPGGWEGL